MVAAPVAEPPIPATQVEAGVDGTADTQIENGQPMMPSYAGDADVAGHWHASVRFYK